MNTTLDILRELSVASFARKFFLPVTVFFHMMLKKVSTRLNRDLISMTWKSKIFTGIKFR